MKTPREVMAEADAVRERAATAANIVKEIDRARYGLDVAVEVKGGIMSFFKQPGYGQAIDVGSLGGSDTVFIRDTLVALSEKLAKEADEIESRLAVKE